jgi:hypothetical protein
LSIEFLGQRFHGTRCVVGRPILEFFYPKPDPEQPLELGRNLTQTALRKNFPARLFAEFLVGQDFDADFPDLREKMTGAENGYEKENRDKAKESTARDRAHHLSLYHTIKCDFRDKKTRQKNLGNILPAGLYIIVKEEILKKIALFLATAFLLGCSPDSKKFEKTMENGAKADF